MIAPGVVNQIDKIWIHSNTAISGENGRLFNAGGGSGYERAYIDRPKSAGKWFFGFEVISTSLGNGESMGVGIADNGATAGYSASINYPANASAYIRYLSAAYKRPAGGAVSAYTGASVFTAGVLAGISYDADTGVMRGYNYVSGAWIDRGIIKTYAAHSSMVPMAVCGKNPTSNNRIRLRPDIAPPAGFASWV